MFVYGCCVGRSGKFERGLLPSLRRFHPDARVLERRDQDSIFPAYASLMAEAATIPGLEGLVLVHDDVVLRDAGLEERLRQALSDPGVGLVGVVGGRRPREMSWWKSDELVGRVEHATHLDDFTRGPGPADVVDGLLMAVTPQVCRTVRLRRLSYPAFHGYDAELCSLVRDAGFEIRVVDVDLFHDCKPGPWDRPEYGQALLTWQLRWGGVRGPARWSMRARRDGLRLWAALSSHARPASQRPAARRTTPA